LNENHENNFGVSQGSIWMLITISSRSKSDGRNELSGCAASRKPDRIAVQTAQALIVLFKAILWFFFTV